MKKVCLLILTLSLSLFAHDEGHGPKLKDVGKKGGRVTSVILSKDASQGASANLFYKGEIVRSKTGPINVYFYTSEMVPLKMDGFAKTAKALLMGKNTRKEFSLSLVGDHFEGTPPKPLPKRYDIDVTVTIGDKELLAAFDNLD